MRELMAVLALAAGQSMGRTACPKSVVQFSHSVLPPIQTSPQYCHQPNLIVLPAHTTCTPFPSEYSTFTISSSVHSNYFLHNFNTACRSRFLFKMKYWFSVDDWSHAASTSSSLQQAHVHHALTTHHQLRLPPQQTRQSLY